MNYAPGILEHLSKSSDFTEILLAPGTAPVQRTEDGLIFTDDTPLTVEDIRDTLGVLFSLAPGRDLSGEKAGTFSIGVPNRGRFRVRFLSQRGSPAVTIQKVPPEVPALTDLLEDPQAVPSLESAFHALRSGLLILTGPHALSTNVLVYALLRSLSEKEQRLLFLIETNILFLMKHRRSVALQCEVGTDMETLDDAIRLAIELAPDVLFVRDVCTAQDLSAVRRAAEAQIFTVTTVASTEFGHLFPENRMPVEPNLAAGIWVVERQAGRRLRVIRPHA